MAIDHPKDALIPGTQLGRYEIQRVIGRGGFGITYAARSNEGTGTIVAIKELFPAKICMREKSGNVVSHQKTSVGLLQELTSMFLREVEIICRLDHPNIVRGIDWIKQNGTGYLVMNYVSGRNLHELLRVGSNQGGFRVSPQSIKELLSPILNGLKELHRHNILHGDIKPDNIFMGVGYQPILIDLGSARIKNPSLGWEEAATFYPHFAAIEQYDSRFGDLGPWTDIYQISAVAYRCITGGKIPESLERAKASDDPYFPLVEIEEIRKIYPLSMLKAIDHGLIIFPKKRPQSIEGWGKLICGEEPRSSKLKIKAKPKVQAIAKEQSENNLERPADKNIEDEFRSNYPKEEHSVPSHYKNDPLIIIGLVLVLVISIVTILLIVG